MAETPVIGIFKTLTLLWLLYWSWRSTQRILKGALAPALFLIDVHVLLFGLPLLLDLTFGRPRYDTWPTFQYTSADPMTEILYCIFIAACPLAFWNFGGVRRTNPLSSGDIARIAALFQQSRYVKTLFKTLLITPLLTVALSPNPSLYLSYAFTLDTTLSQEETVFHGYVCIFSVLALLSGAAIAATSSHMGRTALFVAPFIFVANWLVGKRTIVAITALLLILILWLRRKLEGWRLGLLGLAVVCALAGFTWLYQYIYRSSTVYDGGSTYESYRIDFGRDHGVKMALYAELNDTMAPILQYRGQSVLYTLLFYIPRQAWPVKPWPYAIYSTSAALNHSVADLGWGITTSCYEEAVANFGLAGLFIAPLTLVWGCRLGSAAKDIPTTLLTILVCTLAVTLQIGAWLPLAIVWLAVASWSRWKRRTRALRRTCSGPPSRFRATACAPPLSDHLEVPRI